MKARHQLGHWHLQIRKLARESAQGVLVEDARLLDVLFSFLLIPLLFARLLDVLECVWQDARKEKAAR